MEAFTLPEIESLRDILVMTLQDDDTRERLDNEDYMNALSALHKLQAV